MKKIFFFLFLANCNGYIQFAPQPTSEAEVICDRNVCCYPAQSKKRVCISSEPGNKNSVVIFEVISE